MIQTIKNNSIYILLLLMFTFTACSDSDKDSEPKPNPPEVGGEDEDIVYEYVDFMNVIETIYTVADELGMKVISDLNLKGGGLYPSADKDQLIKDSNSYTGAFHKKFGEHASFWGWYIDTEINPIENSDVAQSAFWRTIWKALVTKCHAVAPESKVTISPFILLDKEGHRGFKYLQPEEYETWWYNTLVETGIDIIMLQDSGAEHLSFFTLDEREPFFKAFSNACTRAEKELWLNVESAQVEARDWEHAMEMEWGKSKVWGFTEIEWLEQKLKLASKYGNKIMNWGYFPMMNPADPLSGMTVRDIDFFEVDLSETKDNYNAYKTYAEALVSTILEGSLTQPKINGTLWYLTGNDFFLKEEDLKKALRKDIEHQKNAGFEFLWLVNTPAYFQVVKK